MTWQEAMVKAVDRCAEAHEWKTTSEIWEDISVCVFFCVVFVATVVGIYLGVRD